MGGDSRSIQSQLPTTPGFPRDCTKSQKSFSFIERKLAGQIFHFRVLSKYRRFVLISFWGDTANAHHQLCWCFGDPQQFDRGRRRETLISMTSKLISVTHFQDKIRSRRLYSYRMGPKKSVKQRQKAYEEPSEVGRVQGEGQCYSDSVMEMSHGNELMMSWKRVYPVATPNRIAMGNQKATRLILRTGGVTPI